MKKCLLALCTTVLLVCTLFAVGTALAEDYIIQLDVEFEENLIFSKYDVDVFLDTKKVETYSHGKDFVVFIPADAGEHTIWFYEHNDKSNSGSIAVNVQSDTQINCHIECKRNKVKVTKVEITRDAAAASAVRSSLETEYVPENETVNDIGNTKVTKDGVSVTLLGYSETTGDSFMPPDSGKIYVLAEFLIENNSKEELSVSSLVCFDGYCDGYTADYSLGASMAADSTLDGKIAAGKKMKGCIGYEVDKGWKEIEIHVKLDFWSSEDLVFIFHKE